MLLALFVLTGLVANAVLAIDAGTKSVLAVPVLLQSPVVQGTRFVTNGQSQGDSVVQGQQQPVATQSVQEPAVHQPQQVYYSSAQYDSPAPVSRRPYEPFYAPYYANPIPYLAHPQLLNSAAFTAPLQFLVHTPSGPLLFRQVQVAAQQQPLQYVVGYFPPSRPAVQSAPTKTEAPAPVELANETQGAPVSLSSSTSTTVTDVNAGQSNDAKVVSVNESF